MAASVPDRRIRRPLTRVGSVALAAHVFYELAAGVGMPLASVLGPRKAAGCWAAGTAMAFHIVGSDAPADGPDRYVCMEGYGARAAGFVNGLGLAATLAHFTAWPRRSTAPPWLADCEGLGPELVPAYNAILYVAGLAALGGLARESGRGRRVGLTVTATAAPLIVAAQRWEFRRLRAEAQRHPAWWNRRLQTDQP